MSKNTLLSELINYVSANSSGNVTIAAPSSGYALDVSGTGRFTGALASTNFILSGGTGNTGLYYGHTDRVVLANYTAGGIDFETNGGTINMTLFPSGNLGVGASMTDAGYKLDVNGTGRFTGALSGTTATFNGGTSRIVLANNFNTTGNTSSPKLSFFSFGDISTYAVTGPSIQKINTGSYGEGRLAFFQHEGVDFTNETEVFSLAPSGAATFSSSVTASGNINAGTSSAALQANGYQVAKYSYFGYSSGYPGIIIGNTGGQSLFFNVDISGNPSGAFSGAGQEYVWRNTGSFITPNASNNGYNTLLSWNSSGQLTIPQAATFSSSVGTTALNMNNMASLGSIGGGAIYLPYTAGLFFRTTDGATARGKIQADNSNNLLLNSDNGGLVGIGTPSPGSKLQVEGGEIRATTSNGGVAMYRNGSNAEVAGYNWAGSAYLNLNMEGLSHSWTTSGTPRMTLTSGGSLLIGTTSDSARVTITAASGAAGMRINTDAGQNALSISGTGAINVDYPGVGGGRFSVSDNGNVGMPRTYGFTTSNAANLFIDSSGLLYRSTSSLKYKTNVRNYDKGLDILSQMRPVYYDGIGASDSDKTFAGLIAEEVHDLGLTEFVQYAEDGTPDALAYQNMVSLLIKGMQELKAELDTLKNK